MARQAQAAPWTRCAGLAKDCSGAVGVPSLSYIDPSPPSLRSLSSCSSGRAHANQLTGDCMPFSRLEIFRILTRDTAEKRETIVGLKGRFLARDPSPERFA